MTPISPDEPLGPDDDLTAAPSGAAVVGLSASTQPPPGLRARVLEAARSARPAGRPAGPSDVVSAPAALRRMLEDLRALVAGLDDADSRRPSVEGWTVAGLLGHLTAIESHFGAVLGWWPENGPIELEHDHLGMTRAAVATAQALPFAQVRTDWLGLVERVIERLDSLDGRLAERVDFHGFDFSVRTLLIARAFEVWTHTEDICKALGRPVLDLDVARLRLLTETAVAALPIGMVLLGREPSGRSVRIVLEGPGGGSWVQSLEVGRTAGEPVLTLVADAVEFCRVAAKRTPPADLHCTVVGDAALAADVLASVAVFAA